MEKTGREINMRTGLVFGKFMPLHLGHLALIDFAATQCQKLYVVLCYTNLEAIDGSLRKKWLQRSVKQYKQVRVIPFEYDDRLLPNTSVSSEVASEKWASAFKKLLPDVDTVFTSEKYGEFVAHYMNIEHISFDEGRINIPVSATSIRENPLQYWNWIADAAKSFFVKKVALIGSESTGKTTLAERLANHFNTSFVPEMAREVIEKTEDCTIDHLYQLAALHARTILKQQETANKVLFVDTDIFITRSYAKFLFDHELQPGAWIIAANTFDLYLFLETDCDYIQDGTRVSKEEREKLGRHHKQTFTNAGIPFHSISGDWEQRFEKAVNIVSQTFFP